MPLTSKQPKQNKHQNLILIPPLRPGQELNLNFNSNNWKTQFFTKMDSCIISDLTHCSGPIAVCCSVLVDYLSNRMKSHEGLYWHSAEQFRVDCLPACSIRQIKLYLNKLIKIDFLYREYGPGKISMWGINSIAIQKHRLNHLLAMPDCPELIRSQASASTQKHGAAAPV